MEKTGQLLKSERERQKLSIGEISLATKINPKVLQAIEEGRMADLPPKSFLRGFVRSYAKYLAMDYDAVLQTFQEEMGTTTPLPEDRVPASTAFPKRKPFLSESSVTSKTIVVIGILALIGLIIAVKNVIDKYENESIVAPPPDLVGLDVEARNGKAEVEPKANADDEASAKKTETAKEEPPAQPAIAATSEARSEAPLEAAAEPPTNPTPPPPPAAEVKPTVTPPTPAPKPTAAPPSPTENSNPTAATVQAQKPTTPPPAIEDSPQEVIVEALDAVALSVRIDGGQLQKIELKPGQVHIIKAKRSVALDSEDGGVIDITHNGKAKGVPGDLGKPVKVRFP